MNSWLVCIAVMAVGACAASGGEMPTGKTFANSLGMRFLRIEAGRFMMGFEGNRLPRAVAGQPWREGGDPDEQPVHMVEIIINLPGGRSVTD